MTKLIIVLSPVVRRLVKVSSPPSSAFTQLRADEGRSAEILGRIPAGRWGRPEDLQGAAVFLASPAAAYVHGSVLAVDGGWLTR